MKINRLEHTKRLYPHFFDTTDDSNFTKHLKVVGAVQQDIRHKLKTIEWGRILEKPLQIWKTQTEPCIYDMNFKVQVPYLKEINVYKNPIFDEKEQILTYEQVENPDDELGRLIHKTYENDNVKFFEKTIKDLKTNDDDIKIPNDTFALEVITWDDYRFIKGYPENDYTLKEDNILQYRYNETYLEIKIEEISYTKYLTFRVHKDQIKNIHIYKNDELFFEQEFVIDRVRNSNTIVSSSYHYFDTDYTNENTYLQGENRGFYDVEEDYANNTKAYLNDRRKDEYVLRLPLTEKDFVIILDEKYLLDNLGTTDYVIVEELTDSEKEITDTLLVVKEEEQYNGYYVEDNDFVLAINNIPFKTTNILKDVYDLEVIIFETRYHCKNKNSRVYSKRYNGYENQNNDCFDHDYSLDIIGVLLNVPRFRFYQVYRENDYYRTYPTWYNRSTEDDYHYMKRIQYYISNYNHIPFPILEFWKYYYITPTLQSRKKIIGEMDMSYLHTNDFICDDEIIFDEDEPETETITEYSINKATLVTGESHLIQRGKNIWHESIVVKDVYIVPSTDYRLRFGIKDNEEDVTIRLICYNRKGVELRTTPVKPVPIEDSDKDYTTTEDYTYTDTKLTIPNDTVSIKIILESNSPFKFTDVTFERMTIVNLENKYMVTEEDYNSNFYDLFIDYEDIPTNIRMGGGERFSILLKRSLPLTKSGLLTIDIKEAIQDTAIIKEDYSLFLHNILDVKSAVIDEDTEYYEQVSEYITPNTDYTLDILFSMIQEEDYRNKLMRVSVEYYDDDNQISIEEFDDALYSDTKTNINYKFTTPSNTSYIKIRITTETDTELEEIRLSRTKELEIGEIT